MQRSRIALLLFVSAFFATQNNFAKAPFGRDESSTRKSDASLDQGDSQTYRVVTGVVLDPSGAAVPGAQVTLTGTAGVVRGTAVTDSAGSFRFEKLGAGLYSLDVQAAGFRETKVDVTVGKKQVTPLHINLPIASQN